MLTWPSFTYRHIPLVSEGVTEIVRFVFIPLSELVVLGVDLLASLRQTLPGRRGRHWLVLSSRGHRRLVVVEIPQWHVDLFVVCPLESLIRLGLSYSPVPLALPEEFRPGRGRCPSNGPNWWLSCPPCIPRVAPAWCRPPGPSTSSSCIFSLSRCPLGQRRSPLSSLFSEHSNIFRLRTAYPAFDLNFVELPGNEHSMLQFAELLRFASFTIFLGGTLGARARRDLNTVFRHILNLQRWYVVVPLALVQPGRVLRPGAAQEPAAEGLPPEKRVPSSSGRTSSVDSSPSTWRPVLPAGRVSTPWTVAEIAEFWKSILLTAWVVVIREFVSAMTCFHRRVFFSNF